MNKPVYWIQGVIIFAFTLAFCLHEWGMRGELRSKYLHENIYGPLRSVSTLFTDLKFKLRGTHPPKSNVVIVDIDSASIDELGRWPWRRDYVAYLVEQIFAAGAKVVGLDMFFSEPQHLIPEELKAVLTKKRMGKWVQQYDVDSLLARVITNRSQNLVLAWGSESPCRPRFSSAETCPVTDPRAIASQPPEFGKFSITNTQNKSSFDPQKTPLVSVPTLIPNISRFNYVANHAGFANSFRDADGVVRQASLVLMANGNPHPSLPLEMARIALQEELELEFSDSDAIKTLRFSKSKRNIPVTPSGMMEINYRGAGRTLTYLSARDVLRESDTIRDEVNRKLAGISKTATLKDAAVLVGISALAISDMTATPFDPAMPGVEVHATILDNLLSNSTLHSSANGYCSLFIFFLMIGGGILFCLAALKLEGYRATLFFVATFLTVLLLDTRALFNANFNWSTGFLYLELLSLMGVVLVSKYLFAQKRRTFLRTAFSKYVAPAVVQSILNDPNRLQIGGKKKNLSILFSDIRSFTPFAEKVDAKLLTEFLNDYLALMTEIVFAHEGTVDKYVGDAIMAFWGAPLDQPDHARRACAAAIDMMEALKKNRERLKNRYGIDVNIGIGVHTGVVAVGNMGSDKSFNYTVIGNDVNIAARMETATKFFGAGIITSRATLNEIEQVGAPLPKHRLLGTARLKGKEQALELFQLLDPTCDEQGLKFFEEGRALFLNRNWNEAKEKFEAANRLVQPPFGQLTDPPCQLYLSQIDALTQSPPQDDWNGTWEPHSK